MDVLICSSYVPFVLGGGRFIVEWLEQKLVEHGHRVQLFYIPFAHGQGTMFSQMTAFRMLDLAESGDRMIAIRPPAHVIRHPSKVLWFIHHFREYYDMWDRWRQAEPATAFDRAVRERLWEADGNVFAEAHQVFTNSQVVADRLKRFNRVDAEVLYPPILHPERFHCVGYGDELLYVCRVEEHKQQHLFVEAMRHTRSAARLRICGTGLDPAYLDRLRRMVAEGGIGDKVSLDLRWISEQEKADLLSTALAAVYAPHDEDSYGYPSLEASHSAKAILTTTNSGGVLELVADGINGHVVEPDPMAIAEAIDHLYLDRDRTRRMGTAARDRLGALHIDWEHVVTRLLA